MSDFTLSFSELKIVEVSKSLSSVFKLFISPLALLSSCLFISLSDASN